MRKHILRFLKDSFPSDGTLEEIAGALEGYVFSPEFSALYAQRTNPLSTSDLGQLLNLWRNAMSIATDAMAAAITTLQKQIAAGGGVTAAEVTTQITAAVTPLTTQI
jgi:hypothetical protein